MNKELEHQEHIDLFMKYTKDRKGIIQEYMNILTK